MITKISVLYAIAGCLLLVMQNALAEGRVPLQGSKIVRIDDGTASGQCIQQNDKLTVTLRGGTLEKQSRWLGLIQDTELGLTMTTTVSGSTGDDTKSASFAKIVKESVSEFRPGQISLGQEQSLLSKFDLTNGSNTFTVVDLEIGLVRTRGQSIGAKILLGAVATTKSLALPKNPFTSAYGIASTYVNSVFTPLLDQAANDKEATSAHITMNIDAANCGGDDERTGTKMVVFAAEDPRKAGYVDIGHLEQYCWKVELSPSLTIEAAPRGALASCADAKTYSALQNSFLAFYVNALSSQPVKPDEAKIAALPPRRSATTARDAAKLSEGMKRLGVPGAFALNFAKAVVSGAREQEVAAAYGVSTQTIASYRDAIARCRINDTPLPNCL